VDPTTSHHPLKPAHPPQPVDLAQARARLEADLGRLTEQELLRQTSAALHRIETGCYGTCQSCGGRISDDRLLALPRTTLCLHCHQLAEHW